MAANISFLRTPESAFADIPDFPYQPFYLQYENLRMAYVDERNQGRDCPDEVVLCLHGEPTWSYLYRRMIPVFLNQSTSCRVIAPDLFGFGRSDKPIDEQVYTFDFHRDSLLHFIRTLDLKNITLVVQDWGGLLGLTLPLTEPQRFKRLLVMNTTFGIGKTPTKGFLRWRAFSNKSPDMKIGALMKRSCRHLSAQEAAAYDAPFPDQRFKAGVRRFPNLVMTDQNMPGVEVSKAAIAMYQNSDQFRQRDVFVACGPEDPVFGPEVMKSLARVWKNGSMYYEIPGAGHFVQEWGADVAHMALDVFKGGHNAELVKRIQKL